MVMGRRPGVERSSWPVAVTDLAGLLGQMGVGMVRVPFRRPWAGRGSVAHNVAVVTTREVDPYLHGVFDGAPHRPVPVDRARPRRPLRRRPAAVRPRPRCRPRGRHRGRGVGGVVPPAPTGRAGPSSTSTEAATSAPRPACTACSWRHWPAAPVATSSFPTFAWLPSSPSRPTWRMPPPPSTACWRPASTPGTSPWPVIRAVVASPPRWWEPTSVPSGCPWPPSSSSRPR